VGDARVSLTFQRRDGRVAVHVHDVEGELEVEVDAGPLVEESA
jgi:hypothetical protein